jgi:hypothetical protein
MSTRCDRCDHEVLGILEKDYGIRQFALTSAFMGVPLAPKNEAIAFCGWRSASPSAIRKRRTMRSGRR